MKFKIIQYCATKMFSYSIAVVNMAQYEEVVNRGFSFFCYRGISLCDNKRNDYFILYSKSAIYIIHNASTE